MFQIGCEATLDVTLRFHPENFQPSVGIDRVRQVQGEEASSQMSVGAIRDFVSALLRPQPLPDGSGDSLQHNTPMFRDIFWLACVEAGRDLVSRTKQLV